MSQASRRTKALLLAAVVAAMAIAASLAISSSHREAPNIMLDPAADNTDVYAFTAPDAEGALTIVSNWIPGQVPANGPNFFRFDDRARYYNHIDNNGDGEADISYRFNFNTKIRNPNSFLYAGPGTQDFNDPGLNIVQTYNLVREEYNANGRLTSETRIVRNGLVAPPNIGPKTFPNYGNFVSQATRTTRDGTKLFVGSRDDPFFVDLGAAFDAINVRLGTGNQGGGKDDLSGYSTSSTIMQIPEAEVTRDGQAVSSPDAQNAVVGVWSTTERRKLEVTNADYSGGSPNGVGTKPNQWVQVSRLGNPLDQRGDHPARDEGQVQPHDARSRRGAVRPVRHAARARGGAERPVQRQRADDEPHRHRPGGAPGHPGRQPAQGPVRRHAGRHPEAEPRDPAER